MAKMYVVQNITTFEDVLVGELLEASGVHYKLVELPHTEAFEVQWTGIIEIDGQKTAWAENNVHLDAWFHPVGPGSRNTHRMKDDTGYLPIVAC
jgi:hypothetical protein